jgi:hypothetical protein
MGDNGGTLRQGEKESRGRMDKKERGRDFKVKIIICNSYSIANASSKAPFESLKSCPASFIF